MGLVPSMIGKEDWALELEKEIVETTDRNLLSGYKTYEHGSKTRVSLNLTLILDSYDGTPILVSISPKERNAVKVSTKISDN